MFCCSDRRSLGVWTHHLSEGLPIEQQQGSSTVGPSLPLKKGGGGVSGGGGS